MKITFEGTIHEVLDQIEDFCKSVIKESTPEVKVVFEPPCPTHDQPPVLTENVLAQEPVAVPTDLQAACMDLVKGDKGQKAKLVTILKQYGATTVNTLSEEYRMPFWVDVLREFA